MRLPERIQFTPESGRSREEALYLITEQPGMSVNQMRPVLAEQLNAARITAEPHERGLNVVIESDTRVTAEGMPTYNPKRVGLFLSRQGFASIKLFSEGLRLHVSAPDEETVALSDFRVAVPVIVVQSTVLGRAFSHLFNNANEVPALGFAQLKSGLDERARVGSWYYLEPTQSTGRRRRVLSQKRPV